MQFEPPTIDCVLTWQDAYVDLFVVCRKIVADLVSMKHVMDIFSVGSDPDSIQSTLT